MSDVQVREIHMQGFMGYVSPVTMLLPATGVVLISGVNGEGKSSAIEAVSTVLWGKTLRGSSPWRVDEAGEVRLVCKGYEATRKTNASGKKGLSFTGGEEYDTATKATAGMERLVGPWEVWRRTCVFSAYDAAHYSEATDGERKRLLEVLIGADRFDAAIPLVRADLKETDGKFDRLRHAEDTLQTMYKSQKETLVQAKKMLSALTKQAAPDVRQYKQLVAALEAISAKYEIARKKMTLHSEKSGGRSSTIAHLERQLRNLSHDTCPTCTQEIPESLRAPIANKIKAERAAAEAEESKASAVNAVLVEEANTLRKQMDKLQEQKGIERGKLQEAKETEEARLQAVTSVQKATEQLALLEDQLEDTAAAIDVVRKENGVLHAVEHVLGLKGVRAHILGRALGGLTDMANYWLARVAGPDMRLLFRPYSEKQRGGVTDALAMEVTGAGGGLGYKAASGGQRRRIDVAVLLALAELAAGAHGNQGNTLFFDEVFDPLDNAGIEGVASALAEIGKTRPVLVISHNPRLVERLDPAVHYIIQAGQIEQAV